MYVATCTQFAKMLNNLLLMLDKAVAHAEMKKYDVKNVLNARLAPDQFHFIRQVQIACDAAKLMAARLSGQEAPSHPDVETTVEELKERIQKTIDYISKFKESDFTGASQRMVPLPRVAGKGLMGEDVLMQMATPNFYFHLTTAYAILRHNGVDLGKGDFLGALPYKDL